MTSMAAEILLMWATVGLYAAGTVLFTVGFLFGRPGVTRLALVTSVGGLLPHTAAFAVRWVRIGHAPYLGFYEVISGLVWAAVVALALLVWRWRALGALGAAVMPLSLLMIGAAMLAPKSTLEITPRLASWWLTVHVAFARLSYVAFIVSFSLALAYLFRDGGRRGGWRDFLDKLPSQAVVDDLAFKFAAAGFIFLGVMIASGAVWANEAWGRYWAWDPIETWSLISWIVYAVYLHLRLTMGWRGRKAAWVAVVALPIVVFALIGVPIVYSSIHGAYLTGY